MADPPTQDAAATPSMDALEGQQIKGPDGSIYTGICKDLDKRIAMHASGKGAKYVRAHLPFKLIYSEDQPDHTSALKRELQVKRLPRGKKLALADSGNIK